MITPLLLWSTLALAPPTSADASLLTGVVATAAANDTRVDVLTAEDIRTAADLDATRQAMGCSDDTSCLLELANALGAQLIVSGTLGTLGNAQVLQLTILDVEAGRAVGRDSLQAADAAALATLAAEKITARLAAVPVPAGTRARLMVMDFKLVGAASGAEVAPAPPAAAGPPLVAIGGGVAGVSALAVIGGVVCDVLSAQTHTATTANGALSAAEANNAYDTSDQLAVAAVALYAVGGLGVVAGGTVLGLGLLPAE
jgi:hypothetical protein